MQVSVFGLASSSCFRSSDFRHSSRFGLKRVPRLQVQCANGWGDGQSARQLAAEDELDHIRLVPEPAQRRVGRAVQFEREEFLQFDDLQFLRRRGRLRKGHLAAALQNLACRQEIDLHAVSPVFYPILTTLDSREWTSQVGREEFHGLQHVGHDDININGCARIAMLLDGNSADNEMGML